MNDEKLQTFKSLTFGTELEYENITRRKMAEAIQSVVGGRVEYAGHSIGYDAWTCVAPDGRVWKAVRDGWLGDVSFIEADMNHCYGDDGYQRYVGTFKGGILYNLGCHLIDMIEPMTVGMPTRIHSVIGSI